jgi:Neuraminidase (sialidase)
VYAEIVTQGQSSKGWALTLDEDQYMWDPSKPEKGMKATNPVVKSMIGKSKEEIESLTASMYEQMGMAKSGTETFQGKECTVYKGDMGEVLFWKGLLMKMEMKIGTIVSGQEVTSIKTGIPVDNKYFEIPKNITFNEIPGL